MHVIIPCHLWTYKFYLHIYIYKHITMNYDMCDYYNYISIPVLGSVLHSPTCPWFTDWGWNCWLTVWGWKVLFKTISPLSTIPRCSWSTAFFPSDSMTLRAINCVSITSWCEALSFNFRISSLWNIYWNLRTWVKDLINF